MLPHTLATCLTIQTEHKTLQVCHNQDYVPLCCSCPGHYLQYGQTLETMRGLIIASSAPSPALALVFAPLWALHALYDHASSPAPAQHLITLSSRARTQHKALKVHSAQVKSRARASFITVPKVTSVCSICSPRRSLGSAP